MPYVKVPIKIPCPGGSPLKRIHRVRCRCGHGFMVDLGPKWKRGLVVRCPRCDEVVARATEEGMEVTV